VDLLRVLSPSISPVGHRAFIPPKCVHHDESSVTTSTITSIGLRRPKNIVPRRSLPVGLQTVQRERRRCFSGSVIVPLPMWPLAEQRSFGQHWWDGSIGSVGVCIFHRMPVDAGFFSLPGLFTGE
jgi:hypothetical protein